LSGGSHYHDHGVVRADCPDASKVASGRKFRRATILISIAKKALNAGRYRLGDLVPLKRVSCRYGTATLLPTKAIRQIVGKWKCPLEKRRTEKLKGRKEKEQRIRENCSGWKLQN